MFGNENKGIIELYITLFVQFVEIIQQVKSTILKGRNHILWAHRQYLPPLASTSMDHLNPEDQC